MAATFTPISLEEMHEFLAAQGFERVSVPGTIEYVYGKRIDVDGHQLTLRVLTSISVYAGNRAKKIGTDTIKVQIWWRRVVDEEPTLILVGDKFVPVKRTNTWRQNLQKRIDSWRQMVGPLCPVCRGCMVVRTRKTDKSQFFSCSTYPECRGTRNKT